MDAFANVFNKKSELLEKELFGEDCEEYYTDFLSKFGRVAAFISVSDINEQAYVFRTSAKSAKDAWESAKAKALEFINAESFSPIWVKADITVKGEKKAFSNLLELFAKCRNKFYRHGISFDKELERAVTETELNCCGLIDYKLGKIDITELNKHLAANDLKTLSQFPEDVIEFNCKSAFCDEKNAVYELYSEGRNCGRRKSGKFVKETALKVITTSADYLAMQIGLDGKFDYGFYTTRSKAIPGYNILRHSTSIWSLLCSYRITKDKFILEQAENAIGYMIKNMAHKYPERSGKENVLYLCDKTKNEVKIGGNAVSIIVLTEYMNILGSDKYTKIVKELANGILELFDERDGSFFHVLKYPSLAPRDKFRTVYYDGESVFALSRAYSLTKDKRYIEAAQKAADRFIEKNYEQYADHWVAYSINELTKHVPEEKYLEFGLRNVQTNLDKIYNTTTTYHTYLELLCVSFELVERIKENKLKCSAINEFDEKALVDTIFHRADYMLNGYGYPEYVMYFANPGNSLGAFFIRHDDYRIRIDDVQHFCSAYYAVYRNYEKLYNIREQASALDK